MSIAQKLNFKLTRHACDLLATMHQTLTESYPTFPL